uniref:Uncharacterized protein n=2 Tax=Guillardia theta (strain CCMP2712) TaxID=905079 RepID=A0A0C3SI64_GUITC
MARSWVRAMAMTMAMAAMMATAEGRRGREEVENARMDEEASTSQWKLKGMIADALPSLLSFASSPPDVLRNILSSSSSSSKSYPAVKQDPIPQTYWWCEMHHAPQNIQTSSQAVNLASSLASVSPPSFSSKQGLVPVGEATAQDLRTKIIEVKGPARVRAAGDPLPPQTFWCEMHTGAQVELGAAAGATRGELQGMSKEQLIDALLASQQSLKTYKEKALTASGPARDHSPRRLLLSLTSSSSSPVSGGRRRSFKGGDVTCGSSDSSTLLVLVVRFLDMTLRVLGVGGCGRASELGKTRAAGPSGFCKEPAGGSYCFKRT